MGDYGMIKDSTNPYMTAFQQNLSSLFFLSIDLSVSSEHGVAMKICCQFVIFGPGKLRKRSLKVLEMSWNLFGLVVYEPCT